MESREVCLHRLNETVEKVSVFYRTIRDPGVMVYELWSARDVQAHLTFWHESFARNVDDLANGRKPVPLKGRFIELNQSGVDALRSETLETVLDRFLSAHRTIQKNILHPGLTLIPYKRGSRSYTPEEHLEIVNAHINEHWNDVLRATARTGEIVDS